MEPRSIKITFDGGALGNPGKGYGSYLIEGLTSDPAVARLDFSPNGELVTNNQAEYRTLINAMRSLVDSDVVDARALDLEICGDSKLVIEQLAGRWKVKHPDIRPLHSEASNLMRQFHRVTLNWHRRDVSVDKLGH
ncbi:MAG TPA: ribonuclease HI family protein [Thermomicrobiales bacterium]|nr:ribonuclease HI family protein [Thermomicrobiales bacterium]